MKETTDERRLEESMRACYPESVRTALFILGDRAEAEDAVQDAFLRAWRFRDALASGSSVRPWLYRVVVNTCWSKLRQEVPHRERRADPSGWAEVVSRDGSPDEDTCQAELSREVLGALRDLPMHLRVVVVLRYYADLSEREIAIAVGRRPGTVKSRLHEARRRLAAHPALRALMVEDSPAGEEVFR